MRRKRIISLFISTIMFSSLITIGITAIFVSSLAHPFFWFSIGFASGGVSCSNLIILLEKNKKEDPHETKTGKIR